jgi:hypothetical protein
VTRKKRKRVFTGYTQKQKWIRKLASTMYDLRVLLEDDHNTILPEQARINVVTHLEEIYEIINPYSEKYQDTELEQESPKRSGSTLEKKNSSKPPKWKKDLK